MPFLLAWILGWVAATPAFLALHPELPFEERRTASVVRVFLESRDVDVKAAAERRGRSGEPERRVRETLNAAEEES